jgi:hypothetical protein
MPKLLKTIYYSVTSVVIFLTILNPKKEVTMSKLKAISLLTLFAALTVTGCATQQQFLNNMQPIAMQTAAGKGRFELNCQAAMPVLISREVVQPALQGPWVGGIQRAEFTVGVEGCGRRQTYIVVCPQGGDGCFATGPGRFHDWQRSGD